MESGAQAGSNGVELVVLLVEDDDGDALLVQDELAETLPGCIVLRMRTLGEALADPPEVLDCVLLDLGLPDTAGVQTVARLRARRGGAPLVVLTGLADESAGIAAVAARRAGLPRQGRLTPDLLGRVDPLRRRAQTRDRRKPSCSCVPRSRSRPRTPGSNAACCPTR